jgi:BirA family biotin operon repressor/biotin-[acetyl-CoA-carboxylase] ligase
MNWEITEASSRSFAYLETVASTNTWLMSKATVHPRDVALTMNQSAGRGRFGRQWTNRAGEGVALSIVVPRDGSPGITNQPPTWIPLLVGVAVVKSVRSCGVKGAGIKWPNDVLVGGQKLAGILCEVRPDGFVIAGVGINVSFSGERPDARAVSLEELIVAAASKLDELVATVIDSLFELMESDYSHQLDSVISVMDTIGRDVQFLDLDGTRRTGRATGLDQTGALLVEREDGSTNVVASSDIEHLYQ